MCVCSEGEEEDCKSRIIPVDREREMKSHMDWLIHANERCERIVHVFAISLVDFETKPSWRLLCFFSIDYGRKCLLLALVLRLDYNAVLIVLEHKHRDSAFFERHAPFRPTDAWWMWFDCVVFSSWSPPNHCYRLPERRSKSLLWNCDSAYLNNHPYSKQISGAIRFFLLITC